VRRQPLLSLLDDHERVAVGVAEPDDGRDGSAHAADRLVDVHAAVAQVGVHGVDVVGVQRDAVWALPTGWPGGGGGASAIVVVAAAGAASTHR
jgi:hypothetical protein